MNPSAICPCGTAKTITEADGAISKYGQLAEWMARHEPTCNAYHMANNRIQGSPWNIDHSEAIFDGELQNE